MFIKKNFEIPEVKCNVYGDKEGKLYKRIIVFKILFTKIHHKVYIELKSPV